MELTKVKSPPNDDVTSKLVIIHVFIAVYNQIIAVMAPSTTIVQSTTTTPSFRDFLVAIYLFSPGIKGKF